MNNLNRKEEIAQIIENEPKGTIFAINDFYPIASYKTIVTSLVRLEEEGRISRLMEGLYTAPKYSKLIGEYSYPTVDEVADKLAERYSWTICPSGIHALNELKLSTQVPSKYIFVSNGPYRTYDYRNRSITFKKTSNQYITDYSRNFSLVIQAIKAIGKNNILDKQIDSLAIFCKNHVEEDLENDSVKFPVWIREVLLKVHLAKEDL